MTETTGVCEENTPRENNTMRNIGLRSTESGAGEQFLLRDCKARARPKGVFLFTDAGMSDRDYEHGVALL